MDNLVTLLNELRVRLNNSGVERTVGIGKSLGRDCAHYKKSMNLYLRKDHPELMRLIKELKVFDERQ